MRSDGFLPNEGQVDEAVRFYTSAAGAAVWFTSDAVVLDQWTTVKARVPVGEDWSALTEAVFQTPGPPLSEALRDGSGFLERLSGHDPNRTTVTVWVYPDSFNEFRALKAELFRRGYLAAGRPMPAGHPIGGSPDGSRSAAQ